MDAPSRECLTGYFNDIFPTILFQEKIYHSWFYLVALLVISRWEGDVYGKDVFVVIVVLVGGFVVVVEDMFRLAR